MTRDPAQVTADLRRDVRRLVESASAEQLDAMREAYAHAPFLAETMAELNRIADVLLNASVKPCPLTEDER